MRSLAALSLFAAAVAGAAPAVAQDRYGGGASYPAPYAQQAPQRVLSWPGKTIPAPAPPPTSPSATYAGHPAYGAVPQPAPYAQGRGAPIAPYAYQRNTTLYPPQAYSAQPQYAYPPPQAPVSYQPYPPPSGQPAPVQGQPQPQAQVQPAGAAYYPVPGYSPAPAGGYAPMGVYMPPPNTQPPPATAPSGVYPAQPGYQQPGYPAQGLPANAYPPAPFPQGPVPAAPFPAPQAANPPRAPQAAPQTQNLPVPPNSIYAPTPQANGAEPPQTQMLAMNTAPAPSAGARLYSVHRPFGLEPDHPTVSPQFFSEGVDLAEPPPPVGSSRTTANGVRTSRAAELRAMQDEADFGPNAD